MADCCRREGGGSVPTGDAGSMKVALHKEKGDSHAQKESQGQWHEWMEQKVLETVAWDAWEETKVRSGALPTPRIT